MKRDTCSSCGSSSLRQFLDLGESPIADAYTATSLEVSTTYPLKVAVCTSCHLVQLLEVLDSKTLFGTGYSFYSSSSEPLSRYHRSYADRVLVAALRSEGGFILEIGCNDGDMLRWFDLPNVKTLGVDPASGPVAVARERGLNVVEREFTSALAKELRDEHGEADVIVANHVLAHVSDVNDFLNGVATILAPDGVAFIEVQYIGDLLVNNAFDLVYHEHRNFFSLSSLMRAAEMAGLFATHVTFTRRQQGSIRVTFGHRGWRSVSDYLKSERWLTYLETYAGVQGRVERVRTRLWDLLIDARRGGSRVAGYGAPAKATTLLNYCGIDRDVLDYVVDSTPAKQGRYIPGTRIPILAPDATRMPPDAYLLLAWNYVSEIIQREGLNSRWIIPLPGPMFL